MIQIFKKQTCPLFIIVILALLLPITGAKAQENNEPQKVKSLVVYSTKTDEVDVDVRLLDLLVSHFSSPVTFKSVNQFEAADLQGITNLFYYGSYSAKIPSVFKQALQTFQGPIVLIGQNIGQMETHFIEKEGTVTVKHFEGLGKSISTNDDLDISRVFTAPTAKILMTGTNGTKSYPLFVQSDNKYYFATISLSNDAFITSLAVALNHVFSSQITLKETHPAYLRMEDVSPAANPRQLMTIAKYLKEQNVPYMVATIPVYFDPDAGKLIHMKDSPLVVKALQYMQANGGSIIMHGYTHQYRGDETGEGFEFWDVQNNTPILAPPGDTKPIGKSFEREYIQNRATRGILELTSVGLYPLAFEPPHYVMSLEGYKILSQYFSTYVGDVQLSDKDWHVNWASPFVTQPAFMSGMKLYPETIGYIKMNNEQEVSMMVDKAKEMLQLDEGVVGGFYHPYLGAEALERLIPQLKQLPNLHWVDLQHEVNSVKAPGVHITSDKNGIKVQTTPGYADNVSSIPIYVNLHKAGQTPADDAAE